MSGVKDQLAHRLKEMVKFYNPYQRLEMRAIVEQWIIRENYRNSIPESLDIFAVFDAVAKRG